MAETSTAVIASANNLSVKYGAQVVLDGATIAFREGEHIGLVGRNGSGKSTFLQIAAGMAQADSGEFTRRRDLVTGYMPQLSGLIEWLEDFLARYTGTCLFVTHDRYFLDRVATRIVELSRGQFTSYDGNYTDYLLARVQRQAVEEMQEHKRQKFLKRELQWVRKAPRARRTKSVDRVERYFEMASQEAPEAEFDVELIIPTPPKLANRIIELTDLSVELGGRTLFQHVNLNLVAGERLGVVGRNGLGKTSLLKVILQELPVASGEVEIGARTQINYVDQNRLLLDDAKMVWGEDGSGGVNATR